MSQEKIKDITEEAFLAEVKDKALSAAHDGWLQSLNPDSVICGPVRNGQYLDSDGKSYIQKPFAFPYSIISKILDNQSEITKDWMQVEYDKYLEEQKELSQTPIKLIDLETLTDDVFNAWVKNIKDNVQAGNLSWGETAEHFAKDIKLYEIITAKNQSETVSLLKDLVELRNQSEFILDIDNFAQEVELMRSNPLLAKMMIFAHHFWRASSPFLKVQCEMGDMTGFDPIYFLSEQKIQEQLDLLGSDTNIQNTIQEAVAKNSTRDIIDFFAKYPVLTSIDSFVRMLSIGRLPDLSQVSDIVSLDANVNLVELLIGTLISYGGLNDAEYSKLLEDHTIGLPENAENV